MLADGLGTAGAVMFLRQFEGGAGNYTDEREQLLENETIDSITKRIRARNHE